MKFKPSKPSEVTLAGLCIIFSNSCTSTEPSSSTAPKLSDRANCALPKSHLDWTSSRPPKLVFISIDSLNAAGLEEYVGKFSSPHPDGFKKILNNANKNSSLSIANPTITASSHTSTITCSSAEKHGVFANSQWNGEKMVSGFNTPIQTETFASTLAKHRLKVVTAGYPALDNSEQGRQVSAGFAYGDVYSQSAILKLEKQSTIQHSWKDNSGKEIAMVSIDSEKNNKLLVKCLDERCKVMDRLASGLVPLELFSNKRRSTAYIVPLDENLRQVYVSQVASNISFPESTATSLDECGIIFSPGKDTSLSKFGAKALVAGMEHRLNFFRDAWSRFLPSTNADAIFLYLEDLDALRHQFAGDPAADTTVVKHLEKVDQLLGEFLSSLPKATNVVIMGDHGMSTVQREINIRKILPKETLENALMVTSGGALLVYGRHSQSGKSISSNPSAADQKWLQDAKKALEKFRVDSNSPPVFEQVLIKNSKEMKAAGLNHPQAPYLIAFANEIFSLQNSLEEKLILADLKSSPASTPRPRGQHGHFNQNPSMKSFLSIWGPQLNQVDASSIKANLDVVPAIAGALAWPLPDQCAGRQR